MKILCTGDLHMGRRSSRLPERVDSPDLSSTSCWQSVVSTALAEKVDVVALSGDVVDQANRYYEAVGPFEAGLKRLAAKGIRTVAVAGNHDHETLSVVADNFEPEEFQLLGRGGQWERLTLTENGSPVLHVDGWSFPQASYTGDPLAGYRPEPHGGLPVLGLLHADLDVGASPYAPVRLTDLRRFPVGMWLLGHVHAPALLHEGSSMPVLYPGSPQALDPGEPGLHGVWLAEVDEGGRFNPRQIPLSTVRYDRRVVDVTDADSDSAIDLKLTEAVRQAVQEVVNAGCGPLRFLSLRLRLTGRTALHSSLRGRLNRDAGDLELSHGDVTAMVERVEIATSPPLDLDELARAQGAPGILARLVRALDADALDAAQQRLLETAARRAVEVHGAKPYRPLPDEFSLDAPAKARQVLRDQSILLLDELLAQKETAQ